MRCKGTGGKIGEDEIGEIREGADCERPSRRF